MIEIEFIEAKHGRLIPARRLEPGVWEVDHARGWVRVEHISPRNWRVTSEGIVIEGDLGEALEGLPPVDPAWMAAVEEHIHRVERRPAAPEDGEEDGAPAAP